MVFSPVPAKARISVLLMVAIMSLPMFRPERIIALRVMAGSACTSSFRAAARDTATSITAPRAEIITPASSR